MALCKPQRGTHHEAHQVHLVCDGPGGHEQHFLPQDQNHHLHQGARYGNQSLDVGVAKDRQYRFQKEFISANMTQE